MHNAISRRIRLNSLKRLNRSYDISDRRGRIDSSKQNFDDFQRILKQSADFDSKCSMWMRIVDLKRMFPDKTTDLILRAMIEAQGDTSRAQVLLGSNEFIFQNIQPLPGSVRGIFIPHVGPFEQHASKYDVQFTKLLMANTHRYASTITSKSLEVEGEASFKQSRNADVIRSLRSQYIQQRKQELMDKFLKVVDKAYFGQALQKGKPIPAARPKTATRR
eukprot:gene17424-12459_t